MNRCYVCFKTYDGDFGVCPHCGGVENTKPVEPIHLFPGTILADRYILGQAVGSGGFGIVYRAWDMKLETIVAVKEFFVSRLVTRAEGLKNLIVSKKSQAEFDYRKERFLAEARTMAKFGAHRSIPNVFEFFEENNTAYIVMELLQGMSLNEYLHQNNGAIDSDFALMIAEEVGIALKSLHEQNIIHRDVAPDNIFICSGKELRIKLMDLGAAKLADSTDDVVDIILKPGYSPAEQYDNGKNIGPWSDVYALGATLYVMLTGVKPDESTNRKEQDIVVPPRELNPDISENLSNSVMKAMAMERHMRFKNVTEFLAAIKGERKIIPLAKEKKRRSLKRALGVSVACIAVLVGAFFVYNTYDQKQKEEALNPADITVWYSVADGSSEEAAMKAIEVDFEEKFPGVNIEMVAIPEKEYFSRIEAAADSNTLPTLFESSSVSQEILNRCCDLNRVMKSEQFKNALFLNQYKNYYQNKKQLPLGIEVPMAYVITNGATSLNYTEKTFEDFDNSVNVVLDERYLDMLQKNFGDHYSANRSAFLNNTSNTSPVMLSSTMALNEVRTILTNYEKSYSYYQNAEIYCGFVYEWSIGSGDKDQVAAGERLLSWMLGNVYQSYLMISECNDGQIPVNSICFESKLQSKYLKPIEEIYPDFVFERKAD